MEYIINKSLKIVDADVCTFQEIGNWYTFLENDGITYVSKKHQSISYSCDCKLVIFKNKIIGYFFAIDKYILDTNYPFNKYDKVYEIYDMSVDYKNKSLDFAIKTFNYLFMLAKQKGCSKVILKKYHEEFKIFYDICTNNFNMKLNNDYLYYDILDHKVLENEKYFIPSPNDTLDLLEVAYLSSKGFSISESECIKVIKDVKITINRKNGQLSLLDNTFSFDRTKFYNLVYFLIESINNNSFDKIIFNKVIDDYLIDAILEDSAILLGIDFPRLLSEKFNFVYTLRDDKIKYIKCYDVRFNEEFATSVGNSYLEVEKIISRYEKMR